jgi:hypothetical protein
LQGLNWIAIVRRKIYKNSTLDSFKLITKVYSNKLISYFSGECMDFRRTLAWLSIAVLMQWSVAPLHGVEINVNGSQSMSGIVWNFGCDVPHPNPVPQGTSDPGRPCSTSLPLVETAELAGTEWIPDRLEDRFGNRQSSAGQTLNRISGAPVSSFAADLDALPPDEKPTGTKIPEPATLALLGAGMITAARVLRIKRKPKDLLRTTVARFSSAHPQSVGG